jgi:hypothetical protein
MSRTLRKPGSPTAGFGGHQLALGGVGDDLVLGGIVKRLRELLFLRADHVLDVGANHAFRGIFRHDRGSTASGYDRSWIVLVAITSVKACFAGREGDDMAAFDEPDIGFISPAAYLLGPRILKSSGWSARW